jgi:hypothetical protein
VLTYSVFKMAIKEHEKKDSRPWPGGRIGMFEKSSKKTCSRIRDVYPGSEFFPSWIRIKKFKYFNPKNASKLSEI